MATSTTANTGTGTKPALIPTPASKTPSNQLAGGSQTGHTPGTAIKGFSGSGVISGKV